MENCCKEKFRKKYSVRELCGQSIVCIVTRNLKLVRCVACYKNKHLLKILKLKTGNNQNNKFLRKF